MFKFARSFAKKIGKENGSIPVHNRFGRTLDFLKDDWIIKGNKIESAGISPSVLNTKEIYTYYKENPERNFKEVLILLL